jgi:hypothetical protein
MTFDEFRRNSIAVTKSAEPASNPDAEIIEGLHCAIRALEKDLRKQKARQSRDKAPKV